jgi:hypothetical protein
MTMAAEPPQSPEQVIEQRLVECGLSRGGITVTYEDYLQSIEIVVTPAAGAQRKHFSCIHKAVDHEIVTFEDSDLRAAYSDYVFEILRPQMLKEMTSDLEKRGLLKGLPKRDSYPDLGLYAEALEEHSGVPAKSALGVHGDAIVFKPLETPMTFTDYENRYSDLLAVSMFVIASGDFKHFCFTGNGAPAETEGE